MFSNRWIAVKFLVPMVFVAWCMWYSSKKGPELELTFWECMAAPGKHDGVAVSRKMEKILYSGKDRIVYLEKGRECLFLAKAGENLENIKKGEYVSMTGVFRREGHVQLEKYHVHRYRRVKMAVSAFALIAVIALCIKRKEDWT